MGNKPFMLTKEIDHLISAIAEAKTSLLIAINTPIGSKLREDELVWLGKLCVDARALVDAHPTRVPDRILIELRVCEQGLDKLRSGS